jgi:hypothetical protein
MLFNWYTVKEDGRLHSGQRNTNDPMACLDRP